MKGVHGEKKIVVVTGDMTVDWNLARFQADGISSTAWDPDDTAKICFQAGGASLLAGAIRAVLEDASAEARSPRPPTRQVRPGNPDYHHSYAEWTLFPNPIEDEDAPRRAWRVSSYIGLDRPNLTAPAGANDPRRIQEDLENPDVVVLDDANLGFRNGGTSEGGKTGVSDLWPLAVQNGLQDGWAVVKIASPVGEGDLFQHLLSTSASRLIAVTTIGDLRRTAVQISEGLSWEQTAQDLFWELTQNPDVSSLSRCAHVVVSMHTAGALLLSRTNSADSHDATTSSWQCRLIFDPTVIEGDWRTQYPGGMIGYTTCLVAGIVRQLLIPDGDISKGISAGVSAMRRLHRIGYEQRQSTMAPGELHFPARAIAEEVLAPSVVLTQANVQDPVERLRRWSQGGVEDGQEGYWTILDDMCAGAHERCDAFDSPLARAAANIVREGAQRSLSGVPICRINHLTTLDRREAEGYRRVRKLVEQYCRGKYSKPLAIGVFGPPGSGKSFGVTQVAESVPSADIKVCEFNLSQFDGPRDLVSALHQVRDVGLSGKTPLVFWDEFDTRLDDQDLGWLRCFLAPIQDGQFRDGQMLHHIGRAIFVFAGGTSATMGQFDRGHDPSFVRVKGPDFVSRLKGYVDIMGPNRQEGASDGDPHFLLRRAVTLRNLIERDAEHLISTSGGVEMARIDEGVLRAFLHITEYKHGIRSMQSIIAMSALAGRSHYERSCLPDASQLELHVDGQEFLALVQLLTFDGPEEGRDKQEGLRRRELLERLAAATHNVYRESVSDHEDKPAHADKPYAELADELKEQNRAFVRHILPKVTGIGYQMMPARSDDPPFNFPGEHLEYLSGVEHERWLQLKLEQGWRWGPDRDEEAKVNPNMVPWEVLPPARARARYGNQASLIGPGPLPEDARKWDRDMIMSIPKLLAKAGYTLIDIRQMTRRSAQADFVECAVRVGVTGHRFLAEEEKLAVSVRRALDMVGKAFPGRPVVIVSPLAEGADRLVAQVGLDRGADLEATLALPVAECLRDCRDDASRNALQRILEHARDLRVVSSKPEQDDGPKRDEAYERCGLYLVENVDALIAIYDGQPAQGRGGTAEVVDRAMKLGLPVLHIKAGNREPGTDRPTSLVGEQGEVVAHNL